MQIDEMKKEVLTVYHQMMQTASEFRKQSDKFETERKGAKKVFNEGIIGTVGYNRDLSEIADRENAAANVYKSKQTENLKTLKTYIDEVFSPNAEGISTSQIEVLKAVEFTDGEYSKMIDDALKTSPTYARLIAASAQSHGHTTIEDKVPIMQDALSKTFEEYGRYCDSLAVEKDSALSDNWGAILQNQVGEVNDILSM